MQVGQPGAGIFGRAVVDAILLTFAGDQPRWWS